MIKNLYFILRTLCFTLLGIRIVLGHGFCFCDRKEKKRLFRVSDKFIDKNAFLKIWKPRSNNKVGQKNEMKRKEKNEMK
jgi:hypothetical protein